MNIRNLILENLEKAGSTRKRQDTHQIHIFQVGDKVLLRVPRVSSVREKLFCKFFRLFEGPYTIAEIPQVNTAVLVKENGEVEGRYNFRSLKPFISRDQE